MYIISNIYYNIYTLYILFFLYIYDLPLEIIHFFFTFQSFFQGFLAIVKSSYAWIVLDLTIDNFYSSPPPLFFQDDLNFDHRARKVLKSEDPRLFRKQTS